MKVEDILNLYNADYIAYINFTKESNINDVLNFMLKLSSRTLVVYKTNDYQRFINIIQPKCSYTYQIFENERSGELLIENIKKIKEDFCYI